MKSIFLPEFVQYPDIDLYNAATLLRPEDRPTVPVRLKETDWKKRPTNAWVDHNDNKVINVSSSSPIFKKRDRARLAATMAHEQLHILGDTNEKKPYEKELQVLKGLGGDSKRQRDIQALLLGIQ